MPPKALLVYYHPKYWVQRMCIILRRPTINHGELWRLTNHAAFSSDKLTLQNHCSLMNKHSNLMEEYCECNIYRTTVCTVQMLQNKWRIICKENRKRRQLICRYSHVSISHVVVVGSVLNFIFLILITFTFHINIQWYNVFTHIFLI